MAEHPFPTTPDPEIPLPDAPLVRVVAQLRFAPVASLTRMEFIAPFQEALRQHYPTMEDQRAVQFVLGPDGVTHSPGDRQWRFSAEEGNWIVTLAPSFMSLETIRYESRSDFVSRLAAAASALREIVGEVAIERLGVRYTDRLSGERATDDLPELVRSEMLPLSGVDVKEASVLASVHQTEFQLNDGAVMTARWGTLPPNKTMTPDIDAIDEASWVLDLDTAFTKLALSEEAIASATEKLCIHGYSFFRWVVTDKFIKVHGGAV